MTYQAAGLFFRFLDPTGVFDLRRTIAFAARSVALLNATLDPKLSQLTSVCGLTEVQPLQGVSSLALGSCLATGQSSSVSFGAFSSDVYSCTPGSQDFTCVNNVFSTGVLTSSPTMHPVSLPSTLSPTGTPTAIPTELTVTAAPTLLEFSGVSFRFFDPSHFDPAQINVFYSRNATALDLAFEGKVSSLNNCGLSEVQAGNSFSSSVFGSCILNSDDFSAQDVGFSSCPSGSLNSTLRSCVRDIFLPSASPTYAPTASPTSVPSGLPTTVSPTTASPTSVPSRLPTTVSPTYDPTASPSWWPTSSPTSNPAAVGLGQDSMDAGGGGSSSFYEAHPQVVHTLIALAALVVVASLAYLVYRRYQKHAKQGQVAVVEVEDPDIRGSSLSAASATFSGSTATNASPFSQPILPPIGRSTVTA